MSEWQPIDTAPKDGSGIRVKQANGVEAYAEWWAAPDKEIDPDGIFSGTDGWALQYDDLETAVNPDLIDSPLTHWKPMPEPPQ